MDGEGEGMAFFESFVETMVLEGERKE